MNHETINEILHELSAPFHPGRITWRPGALTENKEKALALAYADLRAYQDRLDAVCGLDWSVSYTPWGDRIICHLTVSGITRSSTGEADSEAERSEIAGTAAEAQAFKRACAMFGLGRYLYNLPTLWVEYDAEHSRFTDKAKARLNGVVAQHYQRFLEGQDKTEAVIDEDEEPASQSAPVADTTNGHPVTAAAVSTGDAAADKPGETIIPLRQKLNQLGQELYGSQWEQVRAHNVKRLTGKQDSQNGLLTEEQIQKLIGGLEKLKQQRMAA